MWCLEIGYDTEVVVAVRLSCDALLVVENTQLACIQLKIVMDALIFDMHRSLIIIEELIAFHYHHRKALFSVTQIDFVNIVSCCTKLNLNRIILHRFNRIYIVPCTIRMDGAFIKDGLSGLYVSKELL